MEIDRCRLCAEENSNNYQLNNELIEKINSNLPVKVFIGTICAGCHLQLESTVEFFDLIRNGQVILQELESKCFPKLNSIKEFIPPSIPSEIVQICYVPPPSPILDDNNIFNSEKSAENSSQIITKNNSNINDDFVNYTNNNINQINTEFKNEENSFNNNKQRRRKIKTPIRYKVDQFNGEELKKIYNKFGITDDMDFFDLELENNTDSNENIIGFIENDNGQNIGDIIDVPPKPYKKDELNDNKTCTKKYHKTYFICDVCKIKLPNELKLLEHRLTHKNVLYECTECQETFDIRDKLFQHQTEFSHNGQGIIENFMDLAQQKTENLESINEAKVEQPEVAINNSDIYNCKECDIEFKNITECDNHYLVIHGDKYKYYCSICQKSFKCKLNLQRHHKIIHVDFRSYTCRYCGYNFATKLNVDNHEKTHVYEDYVNKTFTCKLCNIVFDYNSSFKRHMDIHANKKPYSCAVCLKVFRQKINLIEHERIHTGIKPFECDKCGDKFSTYSQRRSHKLRLHSMNIIKKKPMKSLCTICGKRLSSKESLRKHNRIHTGDKPYHCDCGHSFSDPSNFRKHKKLHNQNKTDVDEENQNYEEVVQNIFGGKDNNNVDNLNEDVIINNDNNLVEHGIENNNMTDLIEHRIDNNENNLVEQVIGNNEVVNLVEQTIVNNNNNNQILVDQILSTNENNNLCEQIIKHCENNEIMNNSKSIYINGGEYNLVCDNHSFLDGNFELNLNFL